MSNPSSPTKATATYPHPSYREPVSRPSLSPTASNSSTASSGSDSEPLPRPVSRKTRAERPRMADRQRSSSIIVPKGRMLNAEEAADYPPDDARAMSPRRNSQDIEKLEHDVRRSLKEYVARNPCGPQLIPSQTSSNIAIIARRISREDR